MVIWDRVINVLTNICIGLVLAALFVTGLAKIVSVFGPAERRIHG